MSDTIKIKCKTYIKPEEINENIMKTLLINLKRELKDSCSEEYGYILDILCIMSILYNKILSTNSNILFCVEVEAVTLKPEKNGVYTGEVFMIFDKGIFIKIQSKLKILIPNIYLDGYEYDKDKNHYYNKETKKFIYLNDVVKAKILELQYSCKKESSQKEFICIGKFI